MSAGRVGGGLGLGGLAIVAIVSLVFGVDPRILIGMAENTGVGQAPQQQVEPGSPDDEAGQFVDAVLAQTEDVWTEVFSEGGQTYEEPQLVLFSGAVNSACGFAQAATGPFYCPRDRLVYIDLSFFSDLESRFGASGDFAAAYVIAHEVGHHVQNLLGTLSQVQQAQQSNPEIANEVSVRNELQADCYSGIWANRADENHQILEEGDIEEALNAAAAVGDDRIQEATQGRVVPDAFTHGSSEQRVAWFTTGFESGQVEACDTFSANSL